MFKSKQNAWKIKSLFREWVPKDQVEEKQPVYTLFEEDRVEGDTTYKSLYKLFMSSVDEYDFATKHLGGMGHWQAIKKSKWFSQGHGTHRGGNAWLADMNARNESLAKKVLIQAANEGDVPAAKKLFDESKKKAETARGRFVKQEAVKEAVSKSEDKDFLSNAVARLEVIR